MMPKKEWLARNCDMCVKYSGCTLKEPLSKVVKNIDCVHYVNVYDCNPIDLLDMEFLQAMADNMRRGIKNGRKAGDWRDRDEGGVVDRYQAIYRHLIKYENTKELRHLVAASDNLMIVWCHRSKK